MNPQILKILENKQSPLVFDGGISTALYDKGFYINRSFEELNLTEPSAVSQLTQAYIEAGAQLLSTNTFGATIPKLSRFGLQDQLEDIVRSGVRIVKNTISENQKGFCVGALGPLGVLIEPLGPTSFDEAIKHYSANIKVFAEEQVDAIGFFGLHDLHELEAGIRAARQHCSLPIFCHIGIEENMKTPYGNSLQEFAKMAHQYEVDVIGFAGDIGPSGLLTATEKLSALTDIPISVLPNAGLPRYVNDQYIYLCNPDYIGKYAKRFVQAGAQIVGGHCGVHEDHVRAISNSLRMTQNLYSKGTPSVLIQESTDIKEIESVPFEERSLLGRKLKNQERVISVELTPPKGIEFEKFFTKCQGLKDSGVQFVNIPDGARAVARTGAMPLSTYINNHFDLEPIPHFTARDRNLLGLQADLMGAHLNGIRNVLLVTGDPPKLGNCPGATGVYDVDAIGMTHIVSNLNHGLGLGGTQFGSPTEFLIGVALNPTAANQELEQNRFRYKIEAGANFAITQPIYDLDSYQRFFDKFGDCPIPIVMGIWPLVSLRNAEFLKNEVPGVEIPDHIIAEMEKAGDNKEEAVKRGLEIAVNVMEKAANFTQGFQVSAPFNRIQVALNAINSIDSSVKSR